MNDVNTSAETEQRSSGNYRKKIGETTYIVNVHFSETSKETLKDKVKRLIKAEAKDL